LRKDLLRMNWKQRFHGFEFRDNFSIHDNVGSKSFVKGMSSYMIGIAF